MARVKLTPHAAEVLIVIDEKCVSGQHWHKPTGRMADWSNTLRRCVLGPGSSRALKGLERRGLITFTGFLPYTSEITKEGRLLIESWRNIDSWPVPLDEIPSGR